MGLPELLEAWWFKLLKSKVRNQQKYRFQLKISNFLGCKVIAFAGSETKCAWVKELGADHVFNYKKGDISEMIKSVAPDGVNCYFDNVGGEFTAKALNNMALHGRVSICGAISTYNEKAEEGDKIPRSKLKFYVLISFGFQT